MQLISNKVKSRRHVKVSSELGYEPMCVNHAEMGLPTRIHKTIINRYIKADLNKFPHSKYPAQRMCHTRDKHHCIDAVIKKLYPHKHFPQ